ncbi:MAG: accessory gene regulator B family protein, partial [Allobaculum sp.]|nr:accessory gene regulator B family protein [Allobaculum sp.]
PLRSFAGGIHAKTAKRCYAYSCIMIIVVLLVIKFFPFGIIVCSCLSLISGVIIFLLSPVEAENKKLDALEKSIYKKRARIILLIEMIVQVLISFTSWTNGFICFSLAFVSLSLIMLAGIIKKKLHKSPLSAK